MDDSPTTADLLRQGFDEALAKIRTKFAERQATVEAATVEYLSIARHPRSVGSGAKRTLRQCLAWQAKLEAYLRKINREIDGHLGLNRRAER